MSVTPLARETSAQAPQIDTVLAGTAAIFAEMQATMAPLATRVAAALGSVRAFCIGERLQQGAGRAPSAFEDVPSLRDALLALEAELLAPQADHSVQRVRIADHCSTLAHWLEGRGAVRSGLTFAEAAAAVNPRDPRRAILVARLSRACRRWEQASVWAWWAVHSAGLRADRRARAEALTELGHLAASREQYGEAERFYRVACRFAVSRGLEAAAVDPLCGLALMEARRDLRGSTRLFCQALALCEPGSDMALEIAHTVLRFWVEGGQFHAAALLGNTLLEDALPPGDALVLAGYLARAASAIGWELVYEAAYVRALRSLAVLPENIPCGSAVLDLARAHGALAFWPRVVHTADIALMYAQRSGDRGTARLAKRMIAAAQRERLSRRVRAELFPDATERVVDPDAAFPSDDPISVLIAAFRVALERTPGAS